MCVYVYIHNYVVNNRITTLLPVPLAPKKMQKTIIYFLHLEEDFREAKKLKQVIGELVKAGEVLCRYEVEKKEAISREDYDTAKTKKVSV